MTTVRSRLTGLVGLLGILALVLGAPAVLIAIGATPFPDGIPTWQQAWATLTGVDDGTVLLTVTRLAAWAAWAYLALGVLVEVLARARHIRAPRITGLGVGQATGRALVSAAVLLFTTLPTLTAVAAPATAVVAVTPDDDGTRVGGVLTHPGPSTATAAAASVAGTTATPGGHTATAVAEVAPLVHTVRPGETLWGIAEHYLGDGARFVEIATANYGAPQPDGRTLTVSHRIHPGWHLTIPTDPTTGDDTAAAGAGAYVVQAGDTLWGIAEDELGDGARYGEIYTASVGITQPGGYHLVDPSQISPGWTLTIPETPTPAPVAALDPAATPATPADDAVAADATTPPTAPDQPEAQASVPTPESEVPTTTPTPTPTPGPTPELTATPGPSGAVVPPPGAAVDEAAPDADETHGATGDAEAAEADDAADGDAADGDDADLVGWLSWTSSGVGSLLAAGVVGVLTRRRWAQQRRRRPGEVLPMPGPDAAEAERDLRVVADPLTVDSLDRALRSLAADRAQAGQGLPDIRWVHLADTHIVVHLAEPAHLPDPWTGTSDGMIWHMPADTPPTVDSADPAGAEAGPAPYPALVTLGQDLDGRHVLVDLEHVRALTLAGDVDRAGQVMAALAMELATSSWGEGLRVTVVAAHPDLEDAMRTGRVRYLPAVGRVLDDLHTRAVEDRAALAEDGALDLLHARVSGAAPDAWASEILMLATPPTDRHRTQLATVLHGEPRVAIAAVTLQPGVGDWTLTLDADDDVAVLHPLGIRLRPQRLEPATYRHILDLVTLTTTDPTPAPAAATPAAYWPTTADQAEHTHPAPAGPENPSPPEATGPENPDGPEPGGPENPSPPEATGPENPGGPEPGGPENPGGPEAGGPENPGGPEPGGPENPGGPEAGGPENPGGPEAGGPENPGEPEPGGPENPGGPEAGGPENPGQPVVRGLVGGDDPRVGRRAPLVGLLGPVRVEHARGTWPEPSRLVRRIELAAYLVCHPGAAVASIDAAVWPESTPEAAASSRYRAMSDLRSWFDADDGALYLPRNQRKRVWLHPGVRSDWDLWCDLLPDGPAPAPTPALEAALALVRGAPFADAAPNRYAWSEPLAREMISQIVDTSFELARRRATAGDWRGAEDAAVVGLGVDQGLERLWRVRILAAHATRPGEPTKEVIARMLTIAEALGGDLEDDTRTLLTGIARGAHPDTLTQGVL